MPPPCTRPLQVIGSAVALKLLLGIPLPAGVVITALDVFLLLFVHHRRFRLLELLVFALILVVMVAFIIELAFVKVRGAAAETSGCARGVVVWRKQRRSSTVRSPLAICCAPLQAPVADVMYGMFVPSKGLVTDSEMIMLACGILGATVMCVRHITTRAAVSVASWCAGVIQRPLMRVYRSLAHTAGRTTCTCTPRSSRRANPQRGPKASARPSSSRPSTARLRSQWRCSSTLPCERGWAGVCAGRALLRAPFALHQRSDWPASRLQLDRRRRHVSLHRQHGRRGAGGRVPAAGHGTRQDGRQRPICYCAAGGGAELDAYGHAGGCVPLPPHWHASPPRRLCSHHSSVLRSACCLQCDSPAARCPRVQAKS